MYDEDELTAAEHAENEAWELEQEEEYLRTASREELIDELRALRQSRTELLILAFRARKWLERNECFAEMVIGTEAIQSKNPSPHESLEHVLQVADMGLKMFHLDRSVEEGVAGNLPAVAAAMVANRRYEARTCTKAWPTAARKFYLSNTLLASVMAREGGLQRSLHPKTEYWASLMDVFPEDLFDVLGEHTHYDPVDGTQAKALGYDAGYTAHDRPIVPGGVYIKNPYETGTFLNAVWHRTYFEGMSARTKDENEAFVKRCEVRCC